MHILSRPRPPAHMRIAALALLGLAMLAGCGRSDPFGYSKQQLELQQQQQAAQRAQERQQALEPVQRLVEAVWLVTAAAVPLLALGVGVDAYRQRRRPLIAPDARGLLPISRTTLTDVRIRQEELERAITGALMAFHRSQLAAAERPVIDKLNVTISAPARPAVPYVPPLLPAAAEPAPVAPTLPDVIALADVLPAIRPGYLALGQGPDGLISLPFGRCYHALLSGDTRSGKTNGLDSLIVQLHHMAARLPISLYGGDYKRELQAVWAASPLFRTIETEPRGIADMVVDLVQGENGVHARYDSFRQAGQERGRIVRNISDFKTITGHMPRLSILVLDELNAVIEAARKSDRLAESLKILLQMGAGAGVFVLGGAQYLSAQVFSRDGSKQFTSRALFGAFDPTAARMMFGSTPPPDAVELLTGRAGRGLIRTVQQQHPVAFQALLTTESDILDAITAAGNVSPTHPVTPSSALESPRTALPSPATYPHPSKTTAKRPRKALPWTCRKLNDSRLSRWRGRGSVAPKYASSCMAFRQGGHTKKYRPCWTRRAYREASP